MDSSSVIFKKSRSRPGQRAREKSPEVVSQTASGRAESTEESPFALASKLKNKTKRTKPKSTLSFGDDEEAGDGEVFPLKKSSLSQKLTLAAHPINVLPVSLDQATISPRSNGTPVYDQAYLSELKASTPSSRRVAQVAEGYDADVSMDLGDITMEATETSFNVDTVIPSESSISSAKQRRERIRTQGTQDDFISLSVTKRDTVPQGPHPESRLMREEDELGEGDDEYAEYTSAQERIALGKKSRKIEASKRKDAMQDMIADAEEEDEETMEWEREQLRRGGSFPDGREASPAKQVYKPATIPASTAIPALGSAIERLSQSLTAITTSHATDLKAAASLVDEREQLDVRETELREMISKAEAKRSWFAAFKEWVESVATFLDEKFPKLEKLEDEHISVLKERSEMIARRRQADVQDDLSLIFGSLPTADEPEEVDDLGRIVPRANPAAVRRERRAARITRRLRRERERETKNVGTQQKQEEGYSTDSSLPPSDAMDYQSAMERITSDGHNLLSDVRAADFRDPSLGLAKWFCEWWGRFGDSYTGAWGGLGLVGAWEFWVRLELLGWNPLETLQNIDEFSWCASLHEYSRLCGDEDRGPDVGPDDDLVSAMISTAIVPLICKQVEAGALDPYSAVDMRNMINLAEQVEASIGQGNHKFQMILKSVYSVFEHSISTSESLLAPFIALNRPIFDPEAITARRRLLRHASKILDTLIQWRKYTGEILGIGELCVRHVNNIALPIAESGWDVGGEEIAREVID
ncbi:hypothetical protein K503DRAFT_790350 [Rhizopogon vinicolor AM-OR11-026]|uniref:GCFC-domain-containing protein n=1 Tax=Rhizopogon vinicolor AM-OR11-026 TaxID=1314800 RepID=A0A1B7NB86_9AGAM|nr:hypothetical protein K503DRAFT_790350 [Rhizopogon vinicolor AM-OR11-026]